MLYSVGAARLERAVEKCSMNDAGFTLGSALATNDTMHRSPLGSQSKRWRSSALALFCVIVCIGISTVGDYGMSWDEPFRFKGGDAKLAYYQSWLSGQPMAAPKDNYPGLFDLPLALAHECLPVFGTRSEKGHVWSLCFGLLGLLSAWRLTARLGGERAGFWALLLLVAVPRYYGHMFFNPKDIPLAATYVFGVWALIELFAKLPKPSWWHVAWVGLAAGLAMSARMAGLLILGYFALFVLLYLSVFYVSRYRSGGGLPAIEIAKAGGFWALRGAVSGGVALLPLLVFWPAMHINPFERFEQTVATVQSYGWNGMVLMNGDFWQAAELPFYYVPYWLLSTLPESLLALFGLASVCGVMSILHYRRAGRRPRAAHVSPRGVLLFAAVFPLCYLLWKDPVLYDGMRHFLFVVPPIACVAALGLEWLLRRAERCGRRFAHLGLQFGVGMACIVVFIEMLALHPYQYVYFNQIAGGLPAAYMRDETDYWGVSHQEAAEWLNAYVEARAPAAGCVYKVHQRYSRWMLEEHLNPEHFVMSKERDGADFFVSVTRFNLHASYPEAELLHVVQRQGVPLCFVFKLSNRSELQIEAR
jgi:hypothetical protein